MNPVYLLLLRWCNTALEGISNPDIPLVVEEQLRDYDLYHTKHGYPALTDEQWGDYQDALITHLELLQEGADVPSDTPLAEEVYGG